MSDKVLKTRIALLYKNYADWEEVKDTYIPIKGEVCFCNIPAGTGAVANEPCVMFKVGNGATLFGQLPWASASAADVYSWAKKNKLDFTDLDDTFKNALLAYIEEHIVTQDTQYRIVLDSASNWKWKLQKSTNGTTWIDAEGSIDIGPIVGRVETLETEVANIKAMTNEEVHEVID